MKKLFLSAIFAVVAFTINAQLVTINVFQTTELRGFSADQTVAELLQDTGAEFIVDTIPYSFTYELDFDTKTCLLKDVNGAVVGRAKFIVKSKKSNRDFQIEFIPTEAGSASGIVVTPKTAAYYIDDTMLIHCTIFKTSYIF